MKKCIFTLVLTILLINIPGFAFSGKGELQNPPRTPTVTIGTVTNATAGSLVLPVTANDFVNLGAFQFTIEYDPAVLTYVSSSDWYTGITAVTIGTPVPGKITFVWAADAQGINIPNNIFFNLNFTYSSGTSAVNWSDNPTPREFADYDGNVFVPAYVNGNVSGGSPQQPILNVTPDSQSVPHQEGTTSFNVSNTGTGTMSYSAEVSSGMDWLTITEGATGGNSGTIVVAFSLNTSTNPRTGTITVTAPGATGSPKIVSVVQDGSPEQPILLVTPSTQNVTSPAGTTNFAVSNTGTGTMTYSAAVTTGGDWLTITGGATGGNTGTIAVAYTENTSITPRTGTITVTAPGATGSPVQVTVYQSGINPQPILTVTPANQNVTSPAGTTSFAVANTGTGTMTYSAAVTTGGDWLTITGGATGGNTGTIAVAYTENTSITPRTGTITVTAPGATGSPVQVTVTQAGANPQPILTVTPTNQNVTSPAGATSFAVANTGTGTMTYSAAVTTGGNWLTITGGATGGNTGTIAVAYTENTSITPRTGTITVTAPGATGSPVQVTVTQAGANPQPILTVTPTNQNVTSPAGATSFAVANTGTGTMTYSAAVTTGGDWLTITGGATGGNTGTIAVAYTENTSITPRTGTITVTAPGATGSPMQVTVSQEGFNPQPTPILTIGTLSGAVSGAVVLPVHAQDIVNLGAFQFTIEYDPAVVTYTGTSNWYAGITAVTVGNPSAGKLTFVWAADLQGINISDGNFFDINFNYISGTSAINWSDNPTPREFSDFDGNIFVPTYANGSISGNVTPQPILSVLPTNQNVISSAGTTNFAVSNTGTGTMTYSASVTTGSDWLSITSGATGGNSGTIEVAFTENTSATPRVGTITVTAPDATGSPMQVTVTQAGINPQPILTVTPANQNVTSLAGTTNFAVSNTGTGTMNYTAAVTTGNDWLTITSGGSGVNSGTIEVAYAANTLPTQRIGTITVTAPGATGSPVQVTVTQEGNSPATPTLTIATITNAVPGTIILPVHAKDFVNLGAFQFTIEYNPAAMTYDSITNWYPGINAVTIGNTIPGKITFVWAGDAGINIPDADFFDINFTYIGGTSAVSWSDDPTPREFVNYDGSIILPEYINGNVSGTNPTYPVLTIGTISTVPGPVSLPVHAQNIVNMGSFQFTIEYDPNLLNYTGTSNWYTGIDAVTVGNPSPGKLTFVWAADAEGINIPDDNFFNIDFTSLASAGTSAVSWSDDPTPREFGDFNGVIFMPNYINGSISHYYNLSTFAISEVFVNELGPVTVPVHATNVTNMGSFQFSIEYDPAHITFYQALNWYSGIEAVTVGNPSAGHITFVWAADDHGIDIPDGNFFDLSFDLFDGDALYTPIIWSDNPTPREFADYDGNIFEPIYVNGQIGIWDGIPEINNGSLKIYPNPASENVKITSEKDILQLRIANYSGQVVFDQSMDAKEYQLNVSNFQPGIYMVQLTTKDGIKTGKLMVQ